MEKRFVLMAMLMSIVTTIYGQQTIMGKVVDAETKKPIRDAWVHNATTHDSTKTNFLGFFQLAVDTSQTLSIFCKGYAIGNVRVPDDFQPFQAALTKLNSNEIYTMVEEHAEFPGGMSALFNYLATHVTYPADAVKNRITGKVFVEFVVDENGHIVKDEVRIVKSLSPSCDAEVIRVVKAFPRWRPTKIQGTPVKSRFVLPITFKD